jgi:hypothetical protein
MDAPNGADFLHQATSYREILAAMRCAQGDALTFSIEQSARQLKPMKNLRRCGDLPRMTLSVFCRMEQ